MVVPYLDVSHLASASSFYSAVLQPLGLSYLPTVDQDPLASVTYGFDGEPVLQIRQNPTPLGPLRLSSLVLTAPSRSAVVGFHDCGLRANPPLLVAGGKRSWLGVDGGVARAVVHDLDGNKIETVYSHSSSFQDPVLYAGSTVRETRSAHEDFGRILDWDYDVASARPSITVLPHRPAPDPYHHYQHQQLPPPQQHSEYGMMSRRTEQPLYPLRRSLTHDPTTSSSSSSSRPYNPLPATAIPPTATQRHAPQQEPIQSDSPRQSSLTSGLSTTTVIGALLGVAAGAAMTYGFVSQDRERKPVQEVDAAPLLPRRSTFPERMPSDRRSRHDDRNSTYGGMSYQKPVHDYHARSVMNDYPNGKRVDDYSARRVVYADVVEDCEDVWSPPPRRLMYNGPDYEQSVTKTGPRSRVADNYEHSVAKTAPRSRVADDYEPSIAKTAPRSRAAEDAYDTRSRHSSRSRTGKGLSVRSRSEAPVDREPTTYVLDGGEHRSYAPPRHGAVPRSTHSQAQSHYHRSTHDAERDSYVSARTHRSASTTRPSRVKLPLEEDTYADHEVVVRSRAGSRVSASRPPISGSQVSVRRSSSKARSHVSARQVPLPTSGVGSSHANWDDDLISLAPSDSISCVGSKSSRRSHRHHH